MLRHRNVSVFFISYIVAPPGHIRLAPNKSVLASVSPVDLSDIYIYTPENPFIELVVSADYQLGGC